MKTTLEETLLIRICIVSFLGRMPLHPMARKFANKAIWRVIKVQMFLKYSVIFRTLAVLPIIWLLVLIPVFMRHYSPNLSETFGNVLKSLADHSIIYVDHSSILQFLDVFLAKNIVWNFRKR